LFFDVHKSPLESIDSLALWVPMKNDKQKRARDDEGAFIAHHR
jgi:hypothetical protein